MDALRITGGRPLEGTVRIAGAKNAALPALAACLLSDEPVRLSNIPDVWDVGSMCRLLETLGAEVDRDGARATVRVARVTSHEAPYELVRKMRASFLVLGPLVARTGRARVSLPGGCAIGARPIDRHLRGLQALGAEIELDEGYVEARADGLRGGEVIFDEPTVTGTENLLTAAVLAEGETVLRNCALEPEVADLAHMLVAMGARIEGIGTDTMVVQGVTSLHAAEHTVIPDRIEAGTYLVATAITGGRVTLEGVSTEHLRAVTDALDAVGLTFRAEGDALTVGNGRPLRSLNVETRPYPGFPTDMQAQWMVLMTQAGGDASIRETIFEQRFMHAQELGRMGAQIRVAGRTALVSGPTPLIGAEVTASDLRASACLVLAGLAARGVTTVHRVYHLDRGYEAMEEKLGKLGAHVERLREGGP